MFCHNISFPHCCFSLFGLVLRAKHPFCSRYRQHLAITESHDTEVRTTHNAWHCVQVFWQTPMWSTLCDTCRKSRIYELSFPDQRTFIPASWPLPDAIQRKQQTSFSGTLKHEIHRAHFTLVTLVGLNGFKNKMWRAILHYACEILV